MTEPSVFDEMPVEQSLRGILEPLDRQLTRISTLLPLALVTVVPLVFFLFWLGLDLTGRRSLVLAGGAFCALIAVYLTWELAVARIARWHFDRRFPAGSPERAIAMRMLFEMETPSKAEDKLRIALASSSQDSVIRRRPPAENESPVWVPPTVTDIHFDPTSVPPVDSTPTPRPGGYYDYIPLEPRPEADRSGEHRTV